jgi:hypothetical protein
MSDKLKEALIKYLRQLAQLEFSQSVIVRVNSCEFVDRLLGRREERSTNSHE